MSNVGLWAPWYAGLPPDAPPEPYGVSATYVLGATFLVECPMVEDWGCGKGWFKTLIAAERYLGIDGTPSPFVDIVHDLETYRSTVQGIFMRGVLEHNYGWGAVLTNALSSFTQRMALVLFTPMAETTREIAFVKEIGVPDLSFCHEDLVEMFEIHGVSSTYEDLASPGTGYGVERIYYLEKL